MFFLLCLSALSGRNDHDRGYIQREELSFQRTARPQALRFALPLFVVEFSNLVDEHSIRGRGTALPYPCLDNNLALVIQRMATDGGPHFREEVAFQVSEEEIL